VLYSAFGAHVETLIGKDLMVNSTGWYQAIEHWSAMHNQQRLGGPAFFYVPLFLLYELPIFVLAVIATIQFVLPYETILLTGKRIRTWFRNRSFALSTEDLAKASIRQLLNSKKVPEKQDEFIRFCIWWMLLSMAFYAWVGEKVPWLILQQLLPMIFVATYRLNVYKIVFAALGIIFLIVMTWHVAFVPADINEPIVQVQNSEDMRIVMKLMDQSDKIVLASKNYWPLPWYYRGEAWKKITMYGDKVDEQTLTGTKPDIIIMHDAASHESLEGYNKTTFKLSYWFSFYDNENRLLEFYCFRDGKMGSINLDIFTRKGFSPANRLYH
jgi:uncharacterized protein (TIGR03663 family)